MRKKLRNAYIWFMSSFKQLKPGIHILNGHYLTRKCADNPRVFELLLHEMQMLGIEFINIENAVSYIESGEFKYLTKTYVAFTFDDGFEDCYLSLAPALEKFDVNACFFVNPNFVVGSDLYIKNFTDNVVKTPQKKPMSWNQIKTLSDRGFVIGNHTLDHVRLSNIEYKTLIEQVAGAKDIIENKIGEKCSYFAWPYGQLNDFSFEALNIVKEYHDTVFSGCQYRNYFSFNGAVINRRHFEPNWKARDMKFFLSHTKE